VGAEVISVVPLRKAPRESWEIGVEIPAGSTGRIVRVKDWATSYPYVVLFDRYDLEITVREHDVTEINLRFPDDCIVPMAAPVPRGEPVYQPTYGRPHEKCRSYHIAAHVATAVFGLAMLYVQPWSVLVIAGFVAVSYAIVRLVPPLRKYGRRRGHQRTVVNERRANQALCYDWFFAWTVSTAAVFSVVFFVATKTSTPTTRSLAEILVALAMILWVFKEDAHEKAIVGTLPDEH
jgi:hypothetical protein